MTHITLAVAMGACLVLFFLPPVLWLVVYIALLGYYPQYLSVKIASFDFTLCRIVMVAMYANLLLRQHLIKSFRFNYLDVLVVGYFLAQLLSGLLTSNPTIVLTNRLGISFESVLPYFFVRLTMTSKEEYIKLLKWVIILLVPLSLVGFYQCMTGYNPAGFLRTYHAWGSKQEYIPIMRSGFFRANFTFHHSIQYGLFFAILGPLCAGILHSIKQRYKTLYWIGLGFVGVGVFSSMSGSPVFTVLVAIVFISLYKYRRYFKLAALGILLICCIIEVASNRHFYYYPTRFTFSLSSAWYRGRLIDIALFEGGMSGNWLAGYGIDTDAGVKASSEWADKIDYRPSVDMVNEYLLILFRFGLIALIPFIAMVCAAIKRLIEASRICLLDSDKWIVWCVSGSLAGILVAMISVSLSGAQPSSLFFILIGLCGVMPAIMKKTQRANSEMW